ncbi:30S ribosomal protein S13 [Chloroflexota bacterium]
MPRIVGVDVPANKQIWVSLQYIFGIGRTLSHRILEATGIAPETNTGDLTEDELSRLREVIDKNYQVEGDLRKVITFNIKRLVEIGSYAGMRHRHGLPVRGQRTRTNGRTKRGTKKTVAGRGQKRGMAKK